MTTQSTNEEKSKEVNKVLKASRAKLANTRLISTVTVLEYLNMIDVELVIAYGDPSQRTDVCSVLAELKCKEFTPILVRLLKQDDSACVRHEAAFALGQIASPETLQDVTEAALRDRSVLVRHEAALALPYFKDETVRETLNTLCQDKSEDVRESAQTALLQLNWHCS